jgi:hypothetical protein
MASILGGIFRKLTGGGDGAGAEGTGAPLGPAVEHNGYMIQPAPRRERGQWLTAGVISKDTPEGPRSQHFVRAETHASPEQASEFAVIKAKQIINERGDKLFEDRAPPPPEG